MVKAIKISLFFSILIIIINSCEQKYDDFGIVNPGPLPNMKKITIDFILDSTLYKNPSKIMNEDFLYLGSHLETPIDTIASASIMIDCNLSVTDSADLYKLVLPIKTNEIEDYESKEINVYKITSNWNEFNEDSLDMIFRELLTTVYIDTTTGELHDQDIKYVLNYDFTPDTASIYESVRDSTFYGFMFELSFGTELNPLIEFYSRSYTTTVPILLPRKYTTVILPDTTIYDSTAVSKDISLVTRKTEFLEEPNFKVGYFSGESIILKFDYPMEIPEDATIFSAWLALDNVDKDSIYGGIGEVSLYEVLDSTWMEDQFVDSLIYDTGNPYETELVDMDTNVTKINNIEPLLRKWLAEPEKNFGFYLEGTHRNSSVDKTFGYSVFKNARFEVTYIIPPED